MSSSTDFGYDSVPCIEVYIQLTAKRFYCFYEPCASEGRAFNTLDDLTAHVYDEGWMRHHTRSSDPPFICRLWPCNVTKREPFATFAELKAHHEDPHWKANHYSPKPTADPPKTTGK